MSIDCSSSRPDLDDLDWGLIENLNEICPPERSQQYCTGGCGGGAGGGGGGDGGGGECGVWCGFSATSTVTVTAAPTVRQPAAVAAAAAASASNREQDIKRMADCIKAVIETRLNRPDGLSSRVRVHEVILIILLIGDANYGSGWPASLAGILAFCDERGSRCCGESGYFKALDTETMALLWQRIKGNKSNKYETFARAMRVRRSGNGGYFAHQDAGRCKRKRVYKLGKKSLDEMNRLRLTLAEFSAQQQLQHQQQHLPHHLHQHQSQHNQHQYQHHQAISY